MLGALLHEISVVFGCSSNLRTLTVRLADGMGRHLPVVEVESVRLIEHSDEVGICAYAPGNYRRWEGRRSARFLERQDVLAPIFVTDELARVAIAPVAMKLKLPVGRVGLLSIALQTDISVELGSRENTEMLVDVLASQCLRLGQLIAAASRCRSAHQRCRDTEISVNRDAPSHRKASTENSVDVEAERRATSPSITEMPVSQASNDMSVMTIDTALIRCISTALRHAHGKIYGPGGAAELLGLKPSTLQSKMRKLGIERSDFTR